MIVRRVHPDMPTTTVALDLLSRVGSPTKYSLSPFAGYAGEQFRVTAYSDFRADTSFDRLVRTKDVFNFRHKNVLYSVYEQEREFAELGAEDDFDEDEEDDSIVDDARFINEDGVREWKVDDAEAPVYIRRFEDYTDNSRIRLFLNTVLNNAVGDVDGYLKNRQRISEKLKSDSDDGEEEVNANELMVEDIGDRDDTLLQRRSKEALMRSMYRLNLLSREVGINVVSVLLAYCRYYKTQSSKVAGKPQFLVQNGPVYLASSVTGDCLQPLKNPNDRALTKVRNIIWPEQGKANALVDEFYSDCSTFIQCIANLNINARACDATQYTSEWIRHYSKCILVNNYTYVSRKVGGYSINVLKILKNISLDMALNEEAEEEVDAYTSMLNMISTDEDIPPQVYNDLRQSSSSKLIDTILLIGQTLNNYEEKAKDEYKPAEVFQVGDTMGMGLSQEGYILNASGSGLYVLKLTSILPKSFYNYLTGCAYVHCTGWLVFEPVSDFTVVLNLKTVSTWLYTDTDMNKCPRLVVGPGSDRMQR